MSESLDVEAIRALLPHRYPMLLVDRILELVPGERAVGLKNVTINEPFFNGHFPGQAIMPGVLILEAMAQVAGLIILAIPEHSHKTPFLGSIKEVRFLKPVVPGDTVITEATLVDVRGSIGKVRLVATVAGEPVARGEMMFALKESRSSVDQAPHEAAQGNGNRKRQGEDDRD